MANTTTRRRRSPQSNQKQQKSGGSKQRKSRDQEARATLARLEEKDPGLKRLLKKAHGYAIFPTVGRASLVVGGSYGRGVVYEQDEMIGYATIGQTTAGIQLGGKTLSEVLVFENEQALERFKQGKVRFAANASAVLLKAGAAATKGPGKGIKALAYSKGGMALEASIGGQKFSFKSADEAGEDEAGEGQEGRAEGGGASRGARGHEENGGAGLAQSGSRGLRLAAAAAAAALERVKPEDIYFLIEAAHRTLRKFAQDGGEDGEEDPFAQGDGEHDLQDEEEDEHAEYEADEEEDEEEDAYAEDENEPGDEEEEEDEQETAEYDEDEEEEDEGPEAEYEDDDEEVEEEAPSKRKSASRGKKPAPRRGKRAKASSSSRK